MRLPLNMSRYKPQVTKADSWLEIERYYTELNSHGWQLEPLLKLVNHIITNKLSEQLFAITSMGKLIISIYDPIEWNRETLHIEFISQTQKWLFKYYPKPNEPIEFERQYSAEVGIEKFDNFIKMIKWK